MKLISISITVLYFIAYLSAQETKFNSPRLNRHQFQGITFKESIDKGYKWCQWFTDEDKKNSTPQDEIDLENWKNTHNFTEKQNRPNHTLKVDYTKGPLDKEEFDYLQREGYVPPEKLPYSPKELIDRIVTESKAYYAGIADGTNTYGGTNHIQWFLPSIGELMAKNSDFFQKLGHQILGYEHDVLSAAHLIYVPKGKGKAMLHNDWSATSLWNDNPSTELDEYYMNVYISLTKTSEKTSPLFVYPRTHLDYNHSDTTSEYVLKNYKVSEKYKEVHYRTMYRSATIPIRKGQEAAAGEKHVYGIGMCPVYQFYENTFDAENMYGMYAPSNPGEYTMFNPAVMHSSEWTNEEDEPRMSLVVVFIKNANLPYGLAYYFLNNKYYLGDIVNLFTNKLQWTKDTVLYKIEEVCEMFADYFEISEVSVRQCIDEKRYYKDDEYIQLVATNGKSTTPLQSHKDAYEIMQCMQSHQHVISEKLYGEKQFDEAKEL